MAAHMKPSKSLEIARIVATAILFLFFVLNFVALCMSGPERRTYYVRGHWETDGRWTDRKGNPIATEYAYPTAQK